MRTPTWVRAALSHPCFTGIARQHLGELIAELTEWAGAVRPGRMHDQTAVNTEGIAGLLTQHPRVKARVDDGYQGLASAFAEQVTAPPRKPPTDAPAELVDAYQQARTEQSSRRIRVEPATAEHKKWRTLQRWLGRRGSFGETYLAVAGLVLDRAARP
jgi:hypothetical protein